MHDCSASTPLLIIKRNLILDNGNNPKPKQLIA